jgi:hypothetical protein
MIYLTTFQSKTLYNAGDRMQLQHIVGSIRRQTSLTAAPHTMNFIISSMTSHLGHSAKGAPIDAATILTARAICLWNLKFIPDMSTSPAH